MLANELIVLLERVRSAEQALYMLGAQDKQTIEEFEQVNKLKARLLDKLKEIDAS